MEPVPVDLQNSSDLERHLRGGGGCTEGGFGPSAFEELWHDVIPTL